MLHAYRETTMPASEESPRCEKCGRALATRPSDDRPESEPDEPMAPPEE